MRRTLLGLTILLAGCQGTVGPRQRLDTPGPVGLPGRPPDEQEARVRERLPFANAGAAEGPRTYFDNPLTRGGN